MASTRPSSAAASGSTPAEVRTSKTYVSNVNKLKYPLKDKTTGRVNAGEVCKNAADNWPPKWVVDAGLVRPVEEPSKSGNEEEAK